MKRSFLFVIAAALVAANAMMFATPRNAEARRAVRTCAHSGPMYFCADYTDDDCDTDPACAGF